MLDLFVLDAASGGKTPVVVSSATEQGFGRDQRLADELDYALCIRPAQQGGAAMGG